MQKKFLGNPNFIRTILIRKKKRRKAPQKTNTNRRDISRRSHIQREILIDDWSRIQPPLKQEAKVLSFHEKTTIQECLDMLSPKEREAVVMVHGELLSLNEAAQLLKVKKPTVQTLIRRAHQKWEQRFPANA